MEELRTLPEYLKASNADGTVILQATATWCSQCKAIAPFVEKLVKQFPEAKFYKYDTDSAGDIAQELGVSQMPVFTIFQDGDLEDTVTGAKGKALEEAVRKVYKGELVGGEEYELSVAARSLLRRIDVRNSVFHIVPRQVTNLVYVHRDDRQREDHWLTVTGTLPYRQALSYDPSYFSLAGVPANSSIAPGATPTGEITKFDDVEVYITKPADYPHAPSKLLLLLTGGTGVHSTNNQLQADKYASEGFLVVMPDQFAGDPATNITSTAPVDSEAKPSLIEQVKLGIASVAKSFTIDMWLARHTPEKVLPILHRVLTSIKEEYADAYANGGGIYAAGYCFGAKYALLLGSELHQDVAQGQRAPDTQAEEGMVKQGPMVKCAAIAHGILAKSDLEGVTVPTSVVAVEGDPLFPDEVRAAGKKDMEERGLEHELHVYPGVPHGFAVTGNYEDQSIVKAQGEAFAQMLAWLKAH